VRITGGCTGPYEIGWQTSNGKVVHKGCAERKGNVAFTDKEIVERVKKQKPDFARTPGFQRDLDALLAVPVRLENTDLKAKIEKVRELLR
jgi:hypothetical protein